MNECKHTAWLQRLISLNNAIINEKDEVKQAARLQYLVGYIESIETL